MSLINSKKRAWDIADEQMEKLYSQLGALRHDPRNRELYPIVLRLIKKCPEETLLDIGCGVGHFMALARSKGFQTLGLEPSKKIIRLNRELYSPPLRVVCDHVENINQRLKEQVGVVTMLDVLEHIETDIAVLQKINSVMKVNGQLIIVVPQHPWLYGKRDNQIGHFRRYTAQSLRRALLLSGFTPISHRSWNAIGVLPYLISERIFRRPLSSGWRSQSKKQMTGSLLRIFLFWWLKTFERNTDFGFGLSLICIAKKTRRGRNTPTPSSVYAMAVAAA